MKIIITGTPASGNRMISKLLEACGMIRGYWTGSKIQLFRELTQRILDWNNLDWEKPELIKTLKSIILSDGIKSDMESFIRSFPETQIVGWNWTPAAYVLPEWAGVIAPEEMRIIWVVRLQEEEIESIKVRYKRIKDPMGFLELFKKIAVVNLKGLTWIETSYNNYFGDWESELRKITEFVGLKIRPGVEKMIIQGDSTPAREQPRVPFSRDLKV